MRPARQAVLAADFFEHRRADAEPAAGHIDRQVEVSGKLLDARLSLGLLHATVRLLQPRPKVTH